jgi:hypothetical protein
LLIVSPVAVLGQSSSIPDVEPAATFVPATPVAGARLQEAETLQLTDAVIERLVTEQGVSEYAEYFAFDDSTAASDARVRRTASASCKTFPGDSEWPKEIVWDIFNVLLGGALIPTKPIAASCYDSKWGKKDGAKCTEVANKFTDPLFHHADPTSSE